jgi:hypothetical protein
MSPTSNRRVPYSFFRKEVNGIGFLQKGIPDMLEVIECKECSGKFTWRESMGGYPGGKDRENVNCSYCVETDRLAMISGVIVIERGAAGV